MSKKVTAADGTEKVDCEGVIETYIIIAPIPIENFLQSFINILLTEGIPRNTNKAIPIINLSVNILVANVRISLKGIIRYR